MKLTGQEINYIDEQLDNQNIKFQEIYDELKDHLVSAAENERTNANQADIATLYNQIVHTQFPGLWPFEEIVKQYQSSYSSKLRAAMWRSFKQYLTPANIIVMGFLLAVSFSLPHTKPIRVTMTAMLLLVSVLPLVYCYISGRKIKTDEGRQSFVKARVLTTSYVLVWLFNLLFNGLRYLGDVWPPANIFQAIHYSPAIFMLFLELFTIYGLCCIRLCKQEFKIA